jgi:hypothetical protein
MFASSLLATLVATFVLKVPLLADKQMIRAAVWQHEIVAGMRRGLKECRSLQKSPQFHDDPSVDSNQGARRRTI